MAIASDGYVFVPHGVDDVALQALRAEADSLFSLKRSKDALTEEEYFDKGCALDFFTTRSLTENDEARVSMDKYMSRRNGTRRRPREGGGNSSRSMASSPSTICCDTSRDSSSLTTPPSASRPPPSPCARRGEGAALSAAANAPKDGDSRQREDGPTPRWEDHHVSVVREAIFGPLAGFARDALEAERSAAAETHAAAADGRLLLFNEQYVVKPPQSSIEFGWHTDEREQLAMCVFAPGAQPPVYVSVWLALDDCDAANGCLEVYPQAWNQKRLKAPSDEDDAGVVCLPAKAGAAVVFLSNVWHRSGPNQTDKPRRVFYAQYSLDVIRAAPSDPRPLSLAVPCLFSRSPILAPGVDPFGVGSAGKNIGVGSDGGVDGDDGDGGGVDDGGQHHSVEGDAMPSRRAPSAVVEDGTNCALMEVVEEGLSRAASSDVVGATESSPSLLLPRSRRPKEELERDLGGSVADRGGKKRARG